MVSVPSFLLRRLYVKGSLQNTPEGFQFQLKNQLGSGYAKKLFPLMVDGQEVPLEQSSFVLDGAQVPFSSVADDRPLTLAMNKAVFIRVKGAKLTPKAHKIDMSFAVPGLGVLKLDFADVPSSA